MNKEVDLSVSCLGKVKELKYDAVSYTHLTLPTNSRV